LQETRYSHCVSPPFVVDTLRVIRRSILEHYIIKKPDMGITKKETRTRTSPVSNRQTLQPESWKAQPTYGQGVSSESRARILASRKAGIEAPVEAQCGRWGRMLEKLANKSCSRVSPGAALDHVVEIGALNHRCVHQDALYELLLDSFPKPGQRPSGRAKKRRVRRTKAYGKEQRGKNHGAEHPSIKT
jgi:hypothetical protein